MAGSPKQRLEVAPTEEQAEETHDDREVYLRDGRRLTVRDQGAEQLVEIRSESGLVEVRIRLTEEGPVLQMEAARLQLKAREAVEIESNRVSLKGTEQVEVTGAKIDVRGEEDVTVDANGDVRVTGKMIYLN